MFILVVLATSLALALVRGGKIGNLGELRIRWSGLILTGFLIQVLIFSAYWQERSETQAFTQFAYLVSLGLLLTALTVNLRIPGMRLITFGFFLNFITIALNGGCMPAAPSALEVAGLPQLLPGQISNNSIGVGPDTRLVFLSDVFAIPKEFIFANVFSIGDVLIALGAVYLIQKVTVTSPSARHFRY